MEFRSLNYTLTFLEKLETQKSWSISKQPINFKVFVHTETVTNAPIEGHPSKLSIFNMTAEYFETFVVETLQVIVKFLLFLH